MKEQVTGKQNKCIVLIIWSIIKISPFYQRLLLLMLSVNFVLPYV